MTAGEIAEEFHATVPAVNAAIKAVRKSDVLNDYEAVSYTHLDVYKRQALDGNKYIYGNIKYILSEKDYRYITPSETLDIVYLLKTALPHQALSLIHI